MYIDPENGLLDCLLENGILEDSDVDHLSNLPQKTYQDINEILLRSYVEPVIDEQCQQFLQSLKDNDQIHIVKFIISSVKNIGWNDRLLTKEERNIIDRNIFCLTKLIDPRRDSFLHLLVHENCISGRHRQKIETWREPPDMVSELFKILLRKSHQNFETFKKCLKSAMQHLAVEILSKGGVAEISVKLEKGADKKSQENALLDILNRYVDKISENPIDSEQLAFIQQLEKILSSKNTTLIGNRRSHSIAMFFQCESDDSLQIFESFCKNGELTPHLDELFRSLLNLETRIVRDVIWKNSSCTHTIDSEAKLRYSSGNWNHRYCRIIFLTYRTPTYNNTVSKISDFIHLTVPKWPGTGLTVTLTVAS